MLKEGRLRAFRNLPIGWVTHANHGRDITERVCHHLMESILLLIVLGIVWFFGSDSHILVSMLLAGLVVHTIWWIINGNCHVCFLDSFKRVKNAGIDEMLIYIIWEKDWFLKCEYVKSILVYGSFCRGEFHGRSDLDLRIIRSPGLRAACVLMPMAVIARVVSLARGIPTDLQIVDSEEFLLKQMRATELPVCVFGSDSLNKIKISMKIDEVMDDSGIVMKKENNEKSCD